MASRSVAEGTVVELREITAETVRTICNLGVAPSQVGFVAPNAVSIAEAHFSDLAWFRAIYADGRPVGFVMTADDVAKRRYFLWRLMIADGEQGNGYGRRGVELVIEHVRSLPGGTELLTSWAPGEAGPAGFYERLGFEPTGEVDGGEIVGRLRL